LKREGGGWVEGGSRAPRKSPGHRPAKPPGQIAVATPQHKPQLQPLTPQNPTPQPSNLKPYTPNPKNRRETPLKNHLPLTPHPPTRGLVQLRAAVLAVELLHVPPPPQHAAEVVHLLLAQRAVGEDDLWGGWGGGWRGQRWVRGVGGRVGGAWVSDWVMGWCGVGVCVGGFGGFKVGGMR
jgi:hypothetical protein